ncbi:MAG: L-threonylcarbamoyladenylate synthase [Planctomycetaceae bacterium]
MNACATSLQSAAELLRTGHLVAFPTETVYGLGADATNPLAVARIFEAKQRPTFDPLIVHVAELSQVESLVSHFSETARLLAREFWPGPLTLVLPKREIIPDLVTAGLPGVGIRIPRHPVAIELLKAAGCPVAAPSANPFGGISPTTARHVADGLGCKVDCIVDGGPCAVGLESTVLSLMTWQPILLRHGGCPVENIERLIGPVEIAKSDPSQDDAAQPSPGMLSRHYAPGTRLTVISQGQSAEPIAGLRCGLLTAGKQPFSGRFARIISLCDEENLQTCAANFFAALRTLDASDLDVIIVHEFPAYGLGVALNDRLRRAAH